MIERYSRKEIKNIWDEKKQPPETQRLCSDYEANSHFLYLIYGEDSLGLCTENVQEWVQASPPPIPGKTGVSPGNSNLHNYQHLLLVKMNAV